MPESSKKSWRDRGLDFLNNLWAGATLMVVTFVSATLYTHFGKEWARPIMNGLITGAGAMSLYLSLRAVLSLPLATVKATPENIGEKILGWLHKFGLTVKSSPDTEGFAFFLIVTTDGGKKIGINRSLTRFPDYINITGLLNLTEEEKRIVATLSDDEKFDALFHIQRELWRGEFGFNSEKIATTGLTLSMRIPITADITEAQVINGVWKMEAIIGNILGINARAVREYSKKKKDINNEKDIRKGRGGSKELRRNDAPIVSSPENHSDEEADA
jgi:hypothetical protein